VLQFSSIYKEQFFTLELYKEGKTLWYTQYYT